MQPEALLEELCPNCKGELETSRLYAGVCSKCLPTPEPNKSVLQQLEKVKLRGLKEFKDWLEALDEFKQFFQRITGKQMWSMQEVWAKKLVRGDSFAIIAPTGLGKSLFGMVACLHAARRGKAYILVPTSLLAAQTHAKLSELSKNVGVRTLTFHAGMSRKAKAEALRAIQTGQYDLLITTDKFLTRHFDKLMTKFNLVFVDDVDALLRASRNVDKVLMLIGFEPELIELALNSRNAKFAQIEKEHGQLLVAGATIRAKRTKRLKLFRLLLGFEATMLPSYLRNVEDFYLKADPIEALESLVKCLGKGGLIFVPSSKGIEFAHLLHQRLQTSGINSCLLDRMKSKVLERFVAGEYEVLIGVASTRSPLSRGIDLPQTVRYAIFAGIPRIEFNLSPETCSPGKLLTVLAALQAVAEGEDKRELEVVISRLRRFVGVSQQALQQISKGKPSEPFLARLYDAIQLARQSLQRCLTPALLKRLNESTEILVKQTANGFVLTIPDAAGYIQSSGRTSRLYARGISKGLCVLIVDDEKAFSGLKRRMKWYIEEIEWKEFEEREVERVLNRVDEDRQRMRATRTEAPELVQSALLVVESPNKAKTIAKLFGRPARRFVNGLLTYETVTDRYVLTVAATKGHVLDLITHEERGFHGIYEKEGGSFKPVFGPIKRCKQCSEQFISAQHSTCPVCGSEQVESKLQLIETLRELAYEVNAVLLGTDPDMEGERIAWDLHLCLMPYNSNVLRIRFYEVTRRGLREALAQLDCVNLNLVKAQLVRRIEDRWVGFELSKRLWEHFGFKGLSAGRVQTPVLGWIIERNEASKQKQVIFTIELENGFKFSLRKLKEGIDVKEFLNKLRSEWRVEELEVKEVERNPVPPFTTDEMLRTATTKLKLSAGKVMLLAQQLFELGLITYHRTDSTRVSSRGISIAREYIAEELKDEGSFVPRTWEAKGLGVEAAHECIRPTKPMDARTLNRLVRIGVYRFPIKLTPHHFALYSLIFTRFIASQMRAVKLRVQRIRLFNGIANESVELEIPFAIVEEGFSKLVRIKLGERIAPGTYAVKALSKRTRPAFYPFTEGELVARMKERRLGRPSTYTKIIETLKEEGYVREFGRRLVPTELGKKVHCYLISKFKDMVSESLTRQLEELTHRVCNGELNYLEVLKWLRAEVESITAS